MTVDPFLPLEDNYFDVVVVPAMFQVQLCCCRSRVGYRWSLKMMMMMMMMMMMIIPSLSPFKQLFQRPQDMMREINRVLKPGGRAVMGVKL